MCYQLVCCEVFLVQLTDVNNCLCYYDPVVARTIARMVSATKYSYPLIFMIKTLLVTAQPFPDWLVTTITTETQLVSVGTGTFRLTNGLISRDFITVPDFATIDFFSHERKQSILRAIRLILLNCFLHLLAWFDDFYGVSVTTKQASLISASPSN